MVLLLNLSVIGCRSTSKMAAQSYSQGINQQECVRLFRYSDWLSRYQHLNFEQLKICEASQHETNISNIKVCRHTFVSHYSWNFWRNLTIARFQLMKVCKQLALRQKFNSPPETANRWDNGTSLRQLRWIKISREK